MEPIKTPEHSALKGHVIVRGYRAGAIDRIQPFAAAFMSWQRWLSHPEHSRREHARSMMAYFQDSIDRVLAAYSLGIETATDNLIMTGSLTGRDLLIQYLIGGTTYTGGLNYVAIGTGTTTPASTDTQLAAEAARVGPAIITDVSNNQVQMQCYFPDANLSNFTYHEVGSFMNATSSANTGHIFNRALLGTAYTKTSGVDTTLQLNITIS